MIREYCPYCGHQLEDIHAEADNPDPFVDLEVRANNLLLMGMGRLLKALETWKAVLKETP